MSNDLVGEAREYANDPTTEPDVLRTWLREMADMAERFRNAWNVLEFRNLSVVDVIDHWDTETHEPTQGALVDAVRAALGLAPQSEGRES